MSRIAACGKVGVGTKGRTQHLGWRGVERDIRISGKKGVAVMTTTKKEGSRMR